MPSIFSRIILVLIALIMAGCVAFQKRDIASDTNSPNNEIMRPLRLMAQSGIMLATDPRVFQEGAEYEVGSCKKSELPEWGTQLLRILSLLEQNPQLLTKINYIRLEKGGIEPKAEIQTKQNQKVLVVSYTKQRSMRVIDVGDEVPCPEKLSELIGQTMMSSRLVWPTDNQLLETLMDSSSRAETATEGVDALLWLADRRFVTNSVNEIGEVANFKFNRENPADLNLNALNFWMENILKNSEQARQLGIFSIRDSSHVGTLGIHVGGENKLSADINQRLEITSPYLSSKTGDLIQLNKCLIAPMREYKKDNAKYSIKRNNFLFPGIHCAE